MDINFNQVDNIHPHKLALQFSPKYKGILQEMIIEVKLNIQLYPQMSCKIRSEGEIKWKHILTIRHSNIRIQMIDR